jgi:tetratricopeptide (TPR) repeat protein
MAIELGIPGVSCAAAIGILALLATIRLLKAKEVQSGQGFPPPLAAFFPVFVLCFAALFSSPFNFPGPPFVLLVSLGILFAGADWQGRWQASIRLNPQPARFLALTSTVLVLFGGFAFGSRVLAEIRADRIFFQNFVPALNEQDLDRAEAIARRALDLYPYLFDARLGQAGVQSMKGKHEEALVHSSVNYVIQPYHYRNNINLALTLANLGRFEESLAVLNGVLAIVPDSRLAAFNAASIAARNNDPAGAGRFLADYSEAIRHAEPEIFFRRARLAMAAGDREKAQHLIEAVMQRHPESAEVQEHLEGSVR